MTHAGFWVDGAVRKPERRHGDSEGDVLIKTKTNSLDLFLEPYSDVTSGYYWLDTTPRESLTPEELFSVLKVLWPHLQCIKKEDDDCWVLGHGYSTHTPIAWGNLTQYPPPVEPQWIRITRENVGQYLFRDCRTQKNDITITYAGRIVGWCIEDDCCLVESDYQTEWPILQWDHVEVEA